MEEVGIRALTHNASAVVLLRARAVLDAMHLPLTLGEDLAGFVTYDERQSEAAAHQGIRVLAPGVH